MHVVSSNIAEVIECVIFDCYKLAILGQQAIMQFLGAKRVEARDSVPPFTVQDDAVRIRWMDRTKGLLSI